LILLAIGLYIFIKGSLDKLYEWEEERIW
jgi:hypothetical protein